MVCDLRPGRARQAVLEILFLITVPFRLRAVLQKKKKKEPQATSLVCGTAAPTSCFKLGNGGLTFAFPFAKPSPTRHAI